MEITCRQLLTFSTHYYHMSILSTLQRASVEFRIAYRREYGGERLNPTSVAITWAAPGADAPDAPAAPALTLAADTRSVRSKRYAAEE